MNCIMTVTAVVNVGVAQETQYGDYRKLIDVLGDLLKTSLNPFSTFNIKVICIYD